MSAGARRVAKHAGAMVGVVIASPAILLVRLAAALGSGAPFITFGTLFAIIPGRFGNMVRVGYYMGTLAEMSPEARIGFGTFFSKRTARVGRASFGAYCVIGSAAIGDRVMLASRVSVTSGRRQHGGGGQGVVRDVTTFEGVSIGAGSWIGEASVVMASVGTECIVGAGSVVINPVPDRATAAGNPAKVIRQATEPVAHD